MAHAYLHISHCTNSHAYISPFCGMLIIVLNAENQIPKSQPVEIKEITSFILVLLMHVCSTCSLQSSWGVIKHITQLISFSHPIPCYLLPFFSKLSVLFSLLFLLLLSHVSGIKCSHYLRSLGFCRKCIFVLLFPLAIPLSFQPLSIEPFSTYKGFIPLSLLAILHCSLSPPISLRERYSMAVVVNLSYVCISSL